VWQKKARLPIGQARVVFNFLWALIHAVPYIGIAQDQAFVDV